MFKLGYTKQLVISVAVGYSTYLEISSFLGLLIRTGNLHSHRVAKAV